MHVADTASQFPGVTAWFTSLQSRSEFRAAVEAVCPSGDTTLLKPSLAAQPAPHKVPELSTGGGKPAAQKQASKPAKEPTQVCPV